MRRKINIYTNNDFYYCLTCSIKFCPECKLNHDKNYKIIKYDKMDYTCIEHNEIYKNYYEECNKNLCIQCKNEHKEHKIINYGNGEILNNYKNKDFKNYISKLYTELNDIIKKLQNIIKNIEIYDKINDDIINNNNKIRNYQNFKNKNEIINFNNIIIKDIQNIINNDNIINNKFQLLVPMYNKMNKISKNENINYIIGEIEIKEEDINKYIRIINSFEHSRGGKKSYEADNMKNENEIIENCEIKINDEIIPFAYFYKFKEKGLYNIKYTFKNILTRTNHMFIDCSHLKNIDFSNFNSQKVTNMNGMFQSCESLKNINLSNFNTQNVTDISCLFNNCKSLTNIDLSNFNTHKVTNISGLFQSCESLKNINLSNFNTENVTNMYCLFNECKSLTNIDLSNFNTQKVTNMGGMFQFCESIKIYKFI